MGPQLAAPSKRRAAPAHESSQEAAEVMDAIRRIVRMLRLATRAAEVQSGASAAQLFVLQTLAERPATSMGDLAARTLTDPSSVSTVVARLVERGLVERRPAKDDARRMEILLTAQGRSAARKAPEAAQLRIASAVDAMAPTQRKTLARSLRALIEATGAADRSTGLAFDDEPRAPASKRRPAGRTP